MDRLLVTWQEAVLASVASAVSPFSNGGHNFLGRNIRFYGRDVQR